MMMLSNMAFSKTHAVQLAGPFWPHISMRRSTSSRYPHGELQLTRQASLVYYKGLLAAAHILALVAGWIYGCHLMLEAVGWKQF